MGAVAPADEWGRGRRCVRTSAPNPTIDEGRTHGGAKTRSVVNAAAAESQRLNVHISPDAHRRLGIHAIMAGMTPGKLVERLINEHLREWRVQANPAAISDRSERADQASPVNIPAGL